MHPLNSTDFEFKIDSCALKWADRNIACSHRIKSEKNMADKRNGLLVYSRTILIYYLWMSCGPWFNGINRFLGLVSIHVHCSPFNRLQFHWTTITFSAKLIRILFSPFTFFPSVNKTNLGGVGKSLFSCTKKESIRRSARLFAVHQNRIEFILVNWISFLLFLLLADQSSCNVFLRMFFSLSLSLRFCVILERFGDLS